MLRQSTELFLIAKNDNQMKEKVQVEILTNLILRLNTLTEPAERATTLDELLS